MHYPKMLSYQGYCQKLYQAYNVKDIPKKEIEYTIKYIVTIIGDLIDQM